MRARAATFARSFASWSSRRARPRCLARYIAASALAIRPSGDWPAAASATPTLALTRRLTPSITNGCGEGLDDPAGDAGGVRLVGDPLAEHAEAAAAEARDGVAGAQHGEQPRADGAQQIVAGTLAERLVEHLQAVDVHAQDGDAPAPAAQAGECAGDAVREQVTVRQPGQRVVQLRAAMLIGAGEDVRHGQQEVVLARNERPRSDREPAAGVERDIGLQGRTGDAQRLAAQFTRRHTVQRERAETGDSWEQ